MLYGVATGIVVLLWLLWFLPKWLTKRRIARDPFGAPLARAHQRVERIHEEGELPSQPFYPTGGVGVPTRGGRERKKRHDEGNRPANWLSPDRMEVGEVRWPEGRPVQDAEPDLRVVPPLDDSGESAS